MKALKTYHKPEKFQANLNAAIQALRSVTLMLQKEKAAFPNFDGWYGPWQKALKDDRYSKWLNDARVTVFHTGDLDSYSSAEVKLVTWREEVLSTLRVPIQTSAELILENPALLDLLKPAKNDSGDSEDAFLTIERRWTTKDLDGNEILGVLARVYGLIAALVLDAHSHLGRLECISDEHPDFPSSHDRTGRIRCMVSSVEARTERFKASTRERLEPSTELDYTNGVDLSRVAERYGFDERVPKIASGGLDPLTFAKKLQFIAKRILIRDKHHERMMFIRDGRGEWHIITLTAKDRTEKYLLMQLVAQLVEAQGCDALIEIGEVWTTKALLTSEDLPEDVKDLRDRGEALALLVATREGLSRWYQTPIKRGRLGGIKLGDTIEVEMRQLSYLKPVTDVWRKQRVFRAQDGSLSAVWEPDILDPCPCGAPERYGQCCRREVEKLRAKNIVGDSEETEGEVEEQKARAFLARYVIWILQHTAAAMVAGAPGEKFYDDIVRIDALALQSLIVSMVQALASSGKSDLILPQLRNLRKLIRVPRLAMRVTALAADWLFESGRPEEAVLELDALGDPLELKDSLALSLVARHFDLTEKEKKTILRLAIKHSASEVEKHIAMLSLASHLAENKESAEAESVARSILDETEQDKTSSERSDALVLLWSITGTEEDFAAAMKEMEKEARPRNVYRNASHLIEKAKYEEAERLLGPLAASGDADAKLLTFDARLRTGASDSAREVFDSIVSETMHPNLQFAYVTAMAQLVFVGFQDLREKAISLLESLSPTGGEQDKQVKQLLKLLTDMPSH